MKYRALLVLGLLGTLRCTADLSEANRCVVLSRAVCKSLCVADEATCMHDVKDACTSTNDNKSDDGWGGPDAASDGTREGLNACIDAIKGAAGDDYSACLGDVGALPACHPVLLALNEERYPGLDFSLYGHRAFNVDGGLDGTGGSFDGSGGAGVGNGGTGNGGTLGKGGSFPGTGGRGTGGGGNAAVKCEPGMTAPTSSLVAWYPLDGNANESTGNAGNGEIFGSVGPTSDRNQKAGGALSFLGGYVSAGEVSGSQRATWSTWFRTSSGGVVFYASTVAAQVSSGSLVQSMAIGGNQIDTTVSSVSDGRWHHAVLTFDGTSLRSYVDGTLRNTQPATGSLSQPGSLFIGRDEFGSSSFNGDIDDVRYYSRALAGAEVEALYCAAAAPPVAGTSSCDEYCKFASNGCDAPSCEEECAAHPDCEAALRTYVDCLADVEPKQVICQPPIPMVIHPSCDPSRLAGCGFLGPQGAGGLGDSCESSGDCGPFAPTCHSFNGDYMCTVSCNNGLCPSGSECYPDGYCMPF